MSAEGAAQESTGEAMNEPVVVRGLAKTFYDESRGYFPSGASRLAPWEEPRRACGQVLRLWRSIARRTQPGL